MPPLEGLMKPQWSCMGFPALQRSRHAHEAWSGSAARGPRESRQVLELCMTTL